MSLPPQHFEQPNPILQRYICLIEYLLAIPHSLSVVGSVTVARGGFRLLSAGALAGLEPPPSSGVWNCCLQPTLPVQNKFERLLQCLSGGFSIAKI